jgi:hypothetical protein
VTAKISDDDAAKYAAIMYKQALDVRSRELSYRNSGWKGYDPSAPAFDREQIAENANPISNRS